MLLDTFICAIRFFLITSSNLFSSFLSRSFIALCLSSISLIASWSLLCCSSVRVLCFSTNASNVFPSNSKLSTRASTNSCVIANSALKSSYASSADLIPAAVIFNSANLSIRVDTPIISNGIPRADNAAVSALTPVEPTPALIPIKFNAADTPFAVAIYAFDVFSKSFSVAILATILP